MMANIHEDYALIAIEPPFIPERRYYPVRSLIAIFGTLFGPAIGIIVVLIRKTNNTSNQSVLLLKSIEHMSSISKSNKKITIVGAGYVGMSLAVLLSQKHKVNVLDIDPDRVLNINSNNSTIGDPEIKEILRRGNPALEQLLSKKEAYSDADFVTSQHPQIIMPITIGLTQALLINQ